MNPTARTHDISLTSYHIEDLATFGKSLSDAAVRAFPKSPTSSRYKEVHALLLSWEEDNLGVVEEIVELESVLKQGYNFETERWRIPSTRSHNSLAKRLSEFLDEFERKDSLLIVYYGGHGYMNDSRQCVWSCIDDVGSPTVQWSGLQTMLEQAASDVVILLDCCAAASSASDAGNGVTELLAACGFETWAPGVGKHSFTRSLIDELKDWIEGPSISIVKLHSEVLARIKYWKPRYSRIGLCEQRKTPIYICLANEGKQRSIQLHPIRTRESLNPDPAVPLSPLSSLDSSSEDLMVSVAESSQTSLSQEENGIDYKGPKVLISVALEEDQVLHTMEWLEWLESVPAFARAAHVEGIYKAGSSLLLLILPVEIWDMLGENKAVQFLAFVNSRNLLAVQPSPPSGITNKTTTTQGRTLLNSEKSEPECSIPLHCQSEEVAEPSPSDLHYPRRVSHLLGEYITIFLIDDSVGSSEHWAETKEAVMMSAEYVLKECHGILKINFLTSPSETITISKTSDAEWLLRTRLREFRRARPYQRVADFLDSHIDTLGGPDNARPQTYKGLNLVIFLDAREEAYFLDEEFSALVCRNNALRAANIDLGVQFVYMQRGVKHTTHILKLFVLISGRERKLVDHGMEIIICYNRDAYRRISERIVAGAIANFPTHPAANSKESTGLTLGRRTDRKTSDQESVETQPVSVILPLDDDMNYGGMDWKYSEWIAARPKPP